MSQASKQEFLLNAIVKIQRQIRKDEKVGEKKRNPYFLKNQHQEKEES